MEPITSWINPVTVPKLNHPPLAVKNKIDGMANVRFTLLSNGKVANPLILKEWPAGFGFGASALDAVNELRYEEREGSPIQGVIYKFIFKQKMAK